MFSEAKASGGSISALVLKLLGNSDMYGYQIIKELEKNSEGYFNLKEGTLYPILHQLELQGLIESYWENSSSARKRKYYHITEKGLLEVDVKIEQWLSFSKAVTNILGGLRDAKACVGLY